MNKSTDSELANDPSLRWNAYRKWEVLWSDRLERLVRFVENSSIDGVKFVVVAELDSMERRWPTEYCLSVRRPTVMKEPQRPTLAEKQAIVDTQRKGLETRSKK